MAVDKLAVLKQLIIDQYSYHIRKSQKGYVFEGYTDLINAMHAINMFNNFTITTDKQITIIDFFTRKFTNL